MIRINLLPIEDRVREDNSRNGLWIIAALSSVGCLGLILLFTFTLQARALSDLQDEVATLETLSAKYKPLIQQVNQITQERKELETKMTVISNLDQERSYRVRLLEDLNRKMPRYAWLTKFTETGGASAEIHGKTFSNLVVSAFMSSLADSKMYDRVDLSVAKKTEVGEREVVEFRMTAAITNTPGEDQDLQARAEY